MLNLLKTRRSIRKYTEEIPQDEDIDRIVEAGLYAPSARGRQCVKFVVIKNKETRDKIAKLNAEVMGAKADPFYGAPIVIVVFADKEFPTYVKDGSLAIGNMLNEAHCLGLGSCWIDRAKETFESEEGKELLKAWDLEGYEGIGNVIIGFADGKIPEAAPRKENRIIVVE